MSAFQIGEFVEVAYDVSPLARAPPSLYIPELNPFSLPY